MKMLLESFLTVMPGALEGLESPATLMAPDVNSPSIDFSLIIFSRWTCVCLLTWRKPPTCHKSQTDLCTLQFSTL